MEELAHTRFVTLQASEEIINTFESCVICAVALDVGSIIVVDREQAKAFHSSYKRKPNCRVEYYCTLVHDMTAAQAAREFGVDIRTIFNWRRYHAANDRTV